MRHEPSPPANRRVMQTTITSEDAAEVLKNDNRIMVAGVDGDGILRGKVMAKDKFLANVPSGFGMSSALFGWDMHDILYDDGDKICPKDQGYADFIAVPDLESFRRLPWQDDMPFFMLRFESHGQSLQVDGRGMIQSLQDKLMEAGCQAKAGVELEFMNFQVPRADGYHEGSIGSELAAFLKTQSPDALRPLTEGMFGYSVSRPGLNSGYFYNIFDQAERFQCPVEGWHTESGPGVFEAALKVADITDIADRVTLFKFLARSVGAQHGIAPCFMAKPKGGLPGNSGHIHISLVDKDDKNLFTRDLPDKDAEWEDITHVSDTGRHFLAGILNALPDIMPLLAPTINSYKRLVENYWAPTNVSWGLEDRMSSVRLIAPPTCKPSATRLEIRVPGADLHPHYALTALLSAGWSGVRNKTPISIPPSSARTDKPELLPNDLESALRNFTRTDSVPRELLGDEFVDYYTRSRRHELRMWREAVTDWEFKRYIETV